MQLLATLLPTYGHVPVDLLTKGAHKALPFVSNFSTNGTPYCPVEEYATPAAKMSLLDIEVGLIAAAV